MKKYRLIDLISDTQKDAMIENVWEIIPNEQSWKNIKSHLLYCSGVKIRQNNASNILFYINIHSKESSHIFQEYEIKAPNNGYYCYESLPTIKAHYDLLSNKYYTDSQEIQSALNTIFLCHFEVESELYQFILDKYYIYELKENPFENTKNISWKSLEHVPYISTNGFTFCNRNDLRIGIQGTPLGTHLLFIWNKDFKKKNEISKGTVFTFLFENKEKISIKATESPVTLFPGTFQIYLSTNPLLLSLLSSKSLISLKIDFTNGELPYFTNESLYSPILSNLFRLWIKKNLEIIAECGYPTSDKLLTTDVKEDVIEANTLKEQPCSVYLMHDEKNGYYKIGISNHPEYREHTLQSEKPSIVLIKAKEFPIRAIAEAFEAALHKTYEKQRVRGEWFELSISDVDNLKKALS